jgi:hypothetical protein
MPRNVGFNIGIDQALTPRIRVSGGYTFAKATHVARGRNINAPVNGVRPDAQFLNVIETVSDASMRNREAYISSNFSLTPPGPAANQKRINWRRLSFSGSYNWSRTRNNSDGPFSVPASGTLDTEWGPSMFRGPHSGFFSINSSAVRNLNVGFSMNVSQGGYYNITTGYDENFDQILNDRPAGVSRNSGRVPVSSVGMSARLGYTFTFGKGTSTSPTGIQIIGDRGGAVQVSQVGGTTTAGRYRVGINVSVNNLTNRNNYGGYVGTQTSPFFGLPTSSGEPRRILVSMNFGF